MTTFADPAPATDLLGELTLHNLLVAFDGSDNSELALTAAITAARRDKATITLMAVVPDVTVETSAWASGGAPPFTAAELQAETDAEAQALLRATVARMPADVGVTTLIRHGKAGPQIVAQSEAQPYDAVMLGARGVGRIRAMTGSVSTHVLHHASTAVFVAHAPHPHDD